MDRLETAPTTVSLVKTRSDDTPMPESRIRQDMGIAEFLASMRILARVSQAHMADHFGVSQQSISRWTKGISTPNYRSVQILRTTFALTDSEVNSLLRNKIICPMRYLTS